MVLGPAWSDGDQSVRPIRVGGDVIERVREVGERLAGEVRAAETLTDGWANQDLGFALLDTALARCLESLVTTGLWGKDNQLPSVELWHAVSTWLKRGSLQARARFKPRGYAGDYLLLEQLWQNRCCDDPLGRLFDRYFQAQVAVHAVRARMEQAANTIVSHLLSRPRREYCLMSIGSGPASELARVVELLPASLRSALRLTLLDLDGEALDYARAKLLGLLPPEQVVVRRENLFRLCRLAGSEELFRGLDFVLCLGLFDYLADEPAEDLLRLSWSSLRPGGALLVGNFAPHHATRAYMEWFGNWYLIYRDPAAMRQLALRSGFPPDATRLGAERMGVDLFLYVEKG
jgi:hypothetical protein